MTTKKRKPPIQFFSSELKKNPVKDCPFCGCNEIEFVSISPFKCYRIECMICNAKKISYEGGKRQAYRTWNQRNDKEIDKLKEELHKKIQYYMKLTGDCTSKMCCQ